MSRTLIVPSVSRRTVKDGAVVVIDVGRHRVGLDNGSLGPLAHRRQQAAKSPSGDVLGFVGGIMPKG